MTGGWVCKCGYDHEDYCGDFQLCNFCDELPDPPPDGLHTIPVPRGWSPHRCPACGFSMFFSNTNSTVDCSVLLFCPVEHPARWTSPTTVCPQDSPQDKPRTVHTPLPWSVVRTGAR